MRGCGVGCVGFWVYFDCFGFWDYWACAGCVLAGFWNLFGVFCLAFGFAYQVGCVGCLYSAGLRVLVCLVCVYGRLLVVVGETLGLGLLVV